MTPVDRPGPRQEDGQAQPWSRHGRWVPALGGSSRDCRRLAAERAVRPGQRLDERGAAGQILEVIDAREVLLRVPRDLRRVGWPRLDPHHRHPGPGRGRSPARSRTGRWSAWSPDRCRPAPAASRSRPGARSRRCRRRRAPAGPGSTGGPRERAGRRSGCRAARAGRGRRRRPSSGSRPRSAASADASTGSRITPTSTIVPPSARAPRGRGRSPGSTVTEEDHRRSAGP